MNRNGPQNDEARDSSAMAQRIVRNLGPWRYVQFLLVALVAGVIARVFVGAEIWMSAGAGIVVGIGYFLLEKYRGAV